MKMLYYSARLFNYNSIMGTLPCIVPRAASSNAIMILIELMKATYRLGSNQRTE